MFTSGIPIGANNHFRRAIANHLNYHNNHQVTVLMQIKVIPTSFNPNPAGEHIKQDLPSLNIMERKLIHDTIQLLLLYTLRRRTMNDSRIDTETMCNIVLLLLTHMLLTVAITTTFRLQVSVVEMNSIPSPLEVAPRCHLLQLLALLKVESLQAVKPETPCLLMVTSIKSSSSVPTRTTFWHLLHLEIFFLVIS